MEKNYITEGIQAAQAGNLGQARFLFSQAVQLDRYSPQAWLWLGKVVDDREKKIYCFDMALKLDPNLGEARAELAAIIEFPPNALLTT